MKKLLSILTLLLTSVLAFAQGTPETPQMADAFRADGKIYVVVTVVSLVFLGLAIYLIMIDRKVGKLEQQLKNK